MSGKRKLIMLYGSVLVFGAIVGGALWWQNQQSRIYIENAMIQAPVITVASLTGGRVDEVFVKTGDEVHQSQPVARIGTEVLEAERDGVIVDTPGEPGSSVTPGQAVVTMIDPTDLRVVGRVEENKGWSSLHVGQRAVFTVDAFSGKQYSGMVDELSQAARAQGLAFNISEKRATQEFEIKVRYNIDEAPELKQGMSAKLWIYKQ